MTEPPFFGQFIVERVFKSGVKVAEITRAGLFFLHFHGFFRLVGIRSLGSIGGGGTKVERHHWSNVLLRRGRFGIGELPNGGEHDAAVHPDGHVSASAGRPRPGLIIATHFFHLVIAGVSFLHDDGFNRLVITQAVLIVWCFVFSSSDYGP